MSRRRQQLVPVHLNAKGIKSLPTADIHAILRAADSLIAAGGRSLLTKILRGSRSKELLDDWTGIDYQKVQQRIRAVKSHLTARSA